MSSASVDPVKMTSLLHLPFLQAGEKSDFVFIPDITGRAKTKLCAAGKKALMTLRFIFCAMSSPNCRGWPTRQNATSSLLTARSLRVGIGTVV